MRGDVRGRKEVGEGKKKSEKRKNEMVKSVSERYIRILSVAPLSDAEAVGD